MPASGIGRLQASATPILSGLIRCPHPIRAYPQTSAAAPPHSQLPPASGAPPQAPPRCSACRTGGDGGCGALLPAAGPGASPRGLGLPPPACRRPWCHARSHSASPRRWHSMQAVARVRAWGGPSRRPACCADLRGQMLASAASSVLRLQLDALISGTSGRNGQSLQALTERCPL